jgi:enediyne polyketide synthase
MDGFAIVGMACRYPDARSPQELWENVLAQRAAFRRMPPERLRLTDYYSPDRQVPDRTYCPMAAVIEGYEFDRARYRISGGAYRSADLAHWLALDVAAQALDDAGFPEGRGLPREATGVYLGNTLTGEFSRANLMRLRWPYVRRVLDAALVDEGWLADARADFLASLEERYKSPFPPVGEETLAGGLSNTIAGRICNYFDLKGGGYTVDGACASSLLAVSQACSALAAGDLDVALAGGVDLSLDPFELVGFAKTGALASSRMRVFDQRSDGFWPGEGCGVVVVMRREDALQRGLRIYAEVRGWGISSDGSGGLTRPEVAGQMLAMDRAYRRARFGIESVGYFEGHGTGTAVGDATELAALSEARRRSGPDAGPAAIGSIKALIGHTKAAAGAAGLIKAVMALHTGTLPPTAGCERPHTLLQGGSPALRALRHAEVWPESTHRRAAVSGMGFGGINAHVVLEGAPGRRNATVENWRVQDAEIFLLAADSEAALVAQAGRLQRIAGSLSEAEMTDLAAHLARSLRGGAVRAAVVAANPEELERRLTEVCAGEGIITSNGAPRIGYLFPGQGSPFYADGGAWREFAEDLYGYPPWPADSDGRSTAVAQPAIVTAELAGLRALDRIGLRACVAVGHSLGELVALHWAGAIDEAALLRIACVRGQSMAATPGRGAMAAVAAGRAEVERLINGAAAVVAGINSPVQTVISGDREAVAGVVTRARSAGLHTTQLPVSYAFHSPMVANAAEALAGPLERERFLPPVRRVVSTITGETIGAADDLRELIRRQITMPVRFADAVSKALPDVDLWIEVGPGSVLSDLLPGRNVVPLDAGGSSLRGWLEAAAAAFAAGAPIDTAALFAGRFTRPFNPDRRLTFFANPCEQAPEPAQDLGLVGRAPWSARGALVPLPEAEAGASARAGAPAPPNASAAEVVRQLIAGRLELPASAVSLEARLLADLHLNSIVVGQVVAEACRRLDLPAPIAPGEFATASVGELVVALEEMRLRGVSGAVPVERYPAGIESWVRQFTTELCPTEALSSPSFARMDKPEAYPTGHWQVFGASECPLRAALEPALAQAGDWGVAVCLPPQMDESVVPLLLAGAQAVLVKKWPGKFLLVQQGESAAGFARTLQQEVPDLTACVVTVPAGHPRAVEWIVAEALAARGYAEAYYGYDQVRRKAMLRAIEPGVAGPLPLGPEDVLLVTGGGKGIAAECALALAKETGIRLILMGRSRPADDPELALNLDRFFAAGAQVAYVSADVTDAAGVRAALAGAGPAFQPVTAFLHGAGANVPQLIASLDEAAFRRTLAPKLGGARNVLAALDPAKLRLLVTFSSVIARAGMRGEADYAVANEWLSALTLSWGANHSHCRCYALEWSVWSGAGMGQRLGRIEALVRQGVTPITTDEGIRQLTALLRSGRPSSAVVIAGRFGEPPALRIEGGELPLCRFLETVRVHYPGIELVADAALSLETDPYLDDHVFAGDRVFPAVMGLEAMAQAAMALAGMDVAPVFEDVRFARAITVNGGATLRIAAFRREPGVVDVALRSSETGFHIDHFRALCRFPEWAPPALAASVPDGEVEALDLYGSLWFQRGRFRRVAGYRVLRALHCEAEIAEAKGDDWFDRYLPAGLALGDPGARDAVLHSIQPCVPHRIILPVGVDRVAVWPATTPDCRTRARERTRDGNLFVYDVDVWNGDGSPRERWEGLRLQAVDDAPIFPGWPLPVLAAYIERRVWELIPGARLTVEFARPEVRHRPDGKPETEGGRVSLSHCGDLTLAVRSAADVGCDIESVIARSAEVWCGLLGPHRHSLAQMLGRELQEHPDTAATRVWTAIEALKKAGAAPDTPLTFRQPMQTDGWAILEAGAFAVATVAARAGSLYAIAVAVRRP